MLPPHTNPTPPHYTPHTPNTPHPALPRIHRVVSALHAAVKGGDVATVRKMVQASPVPHMLLNTRDPVQGGLAAVHVAGALRCVLVYAALHPDRPNSTTTHPPTHPTHTSPNPPSHLSPLSAAAAARAGQEAVLAYLLEEGACPWLPDKEGLSALDYARVRNRQGCLALLREHIKAAPPQLKEVGPLVASFFEAPVDREWMGWALNHYGAAKLLDAKVSREVEGERASE